MTKHTPFRNYLIPDEAAEPPESGRYAFAALTTAITAIDFDIKGIIDALAQKSSLGHGHVIADVEGLAGALDSKMSSSRVFKLDDLSDVEGAEGAQEGYVLVKTPTGWIPQSALAAVGNHEHTIAQIFGLSSELTARASLGSNGKVLPEQLPALTTSATVGSALAGASGLAAPADGDRFAGVLAGGSTVFWTTWGNIKTALTTLINSLIATAVGGNMAGRAYPRRSDGANINIIFSGQSGQPTWLLGGVDGTNFYAYNPSNFNVNAVGGWTQATIAAQDEARGQAWANYAINNIMPTIAAQGANFLGTYGLMYYTGGTAKGPGDGAAGSELVFSAANPQTGAGAAGSWRCMGYCIAGTGGQRTTLWLRYA